MALNDIIEHASINRSVTRVKVDESYLIGIEELVRWCNSRWVDINHSMRIFKEVQLPLGSFFDSSWVGQ